MALKIKEDLINFVKLMYDILLSDRDVVCILGGSTGIGKSCLEWNLGKAYSKISGVPFGPDNFTWSQKELLKWIDGEKDAKHKPANPSGLRKGQLPEYSFIAIDEIFLIMFKRLWFEHIESLATLNMCRDRHLLICGCVPNFWDLDSAFLSRIRFYIYVYKRGHAYIFQQENNPFSWDIWNVKRNQFLFRKLKKPYLLPNFLCEIEFPDFTPKDKEMYYAVRNKKRLLAIEQSKEPKRETHKYIKAARNNLILEWYEENKKVYSEPNNAKRLGIDRLTFAKLGKICGTDSTTVSKIIMKGGKKDT